jgi:hypothetical protein
MNWTRREFCQAGAAAAAALGLSSTLGSLPAARRLLDPVKQLERWSFWHNRDWDWYTANIPFWESPDAEIDEIYYYRAEVLTKHLRYASPETGYIFTEFSNADRLEWAGRYSAIASAADLQFEEIRWLKTRQYAEDYARYWMLTQGAEPRNYGFPVAWSTWQMAMVHGDPSLPLKLLGQYSANYEAWERGVVDYPHDNGYDAERQLFWNTGRDMGGEFNLASCQLSEELRSIPGYKIRGGAGYRPDINAVLFAEAETIAKLAHLAGHDDVAARYAQKAATLKKNVQRYLWDPAREFFLHRWRYDEYSEGDTPGNKSIRNWSLIWDTNSDKNSGVGYRPECRGAGHGRELTGFIPWRYALPADEEGFAAAWKFLTSAEHFYAPYGPATAEQNDPWFHVVYHACRHNGQSWPFHTARILSAAARLLNDYQHRGGFDREKYFDLFKIYTKIQHKDGRPHLAEAHHAFEPEWVQDEWPGLDYFHSSYMDHIVTGVAGLRPSDADEVVVNPLAPAHWDYFALDGVAYRNHLLSIAWDRNGDRYGLGKGLHLLVDGRVAASSPVLGRLSATLPRVEVQPAPIEVIVSANTEGLPFPKASASFTAKYNSAGAALDGLCWFDPEFGDKWTCRGSWKREDWFEIDFGEPKTIGAVRLFFCEDEKEVKAPSSYSLLYEKDGRWAPVQPSSVAPVRPEANRANTVQFAPLTTRKIRAVFKHRPGIGVGLAQIQALAAPADSRS